MKKHIEAVADWAYFSLLLIIVLLVVCCTQGCKTNSTNTSTSTSAPFGGIDYTTPAVVHWTDSTIGAEAYYVVDTSITHISDVQSACICYMRYTWQGSPWEEVPCWQLNVIIWYSKERVFIEK